MLKISKSLSGKYGQKLHHHAAKSAKDAFKTTSKRAIQKTAEATGDLISNKIAEKITKISKTSQEKITKISKTSQQNDC